MFKAVSFHPTLLEMVVTHNNHKEGTILFCRGLLAFCYDKNHTEWASTLTEVLIQTLNKNMITTHQWDDSTPKKKVISKQYAKLESAKELLFVPNLVSCWVK